MSGSYDTPLAYFEIMIRPTVEEFLQDPRDSRRAFLAAVVTAHYSDCEAEMANANEEVVRKAIIAACPSYNVVWKVANLVKHYRIKRPNSPDKGRTLTDSTNVGSRAAFSDGSYFSDGSSFSEHGDVVRYIDNENRLHDVSWTLKVVLDFLWNRATASSQKLNTP